jgi:hypothetical protein
LPALIGQVLHLLVNMFHKVRFNDPLFCFNSLFGRRQERQVLYTLFLPLAVFEKIKAVVSCANVQEGFYINERIEFVPDGPECIKGANNNIFRFFAVIDDLIGKINNLGIVSIK